MRGIWGEGCTLHKIVKTESECKKAAAELQITYSTRATRADCPAGCYTWRNANKLWFNTITNPSMTSPHQDTAGICKGIVILKYVKSV